MKINRTHDLPPPTQGPTSPETGKTRVLTLQKDKTCKTKRRRLPAMLHNFKPQKGTLFRTIAPRQSTESMHDATKQVLVESESGSPILIPIKKPRTCSVPGFFLSDNLYLKQSQPAAQQTAGADPQAKRFRHDLALLRARPPVSRLKPFSRCRFLHPLAYCLHTWPPGLRPCLWYPGHCDRRQTPRPRHPLSSPQVPQSPWLIRQSSR